MISLSCWDISGRHHPPTSSSRHGVGLERVARVGRATASRRGLLDARCGERAARSRRVRPRARRVLARHPRAMPRRERGPRAHARGSVTAACVAVVRAPRPDAPHDADPFAYARAFGHDIRGEDDASDSSSSAAPVVADARATVFDVGASAGAFTAVAALRLASKGALDLDRDLTHHLPPELVSDEGDALGADVHPGDAAAERAGTREGIGVALPDDPTQTFAPRSRTTLAKLLEREAAEASFAPNAPSDSSPSFAPRRSARAASDTPKSSNARCCVRRLTTRSRRDARRRGQPRRAPRTRPRVSRGRRCATRSSRCSSPRGHPRNPRGRESSRTDRPERPGACWTPRRRRDCDDWRFEDSGIGTGTGMGTGIGTGTGTRCVPGTRSTRWFATRAVR